MSLMQAMRDPNLFEPHFRDPSWRPWKTFMAAYTGEPPRGDDLETYRACTGRTAWPSQAFRKAVVIVGRRGGKSRSMATIATHAACFNDYRPYLAPGQRVRVGILAKDRDQAGEIFDYVTGMLDEIPLLTPMVLNRGADWVELSNRVIIAVQTASFRAVRGFTFAAAVCDEAAFWPNDEGSANPDFEIIGAVEPGLASIPGSLLLIASSPYGKKGVLFDAYRRWFARDDAKTLVWKASTATMNSTLNPQVIADLYEEDPQRARAEYGGEFRDDLADYLGFEDVMKVVVPGRTELACRGHNLPRVLRFGVGQRRRFMDVGDRALEG
jgi:hypothetical protein